MNAKEFYQLFSQSMADLARQLQAGSFSLNDSPFEKIAVAVSGGADSMALCLLLADYFGKDRVMALIVDHSLRPESAAEAKKTAAWLAQRGIASEILVWKKPQQARIDRSVQKQARQARYDLLQAACKRLGCRYLFVAHHGDDQIETFLIRLCAGSAANGLKAMQPLSMLGGGTEQLCLLRPLLGFEKSQLLAYLQQQGQDYIDDPSNRNNSYTRVRMRSLLPVLKAEGLSAQRFMQLSKRLARMENTLFNQAQDFLNKVAKMDEQYGYVRMPAKAFRGLDIEIAVRAVMQIINFVAGRQMAYPRLEKIEKLAAILTEKRDKPVRKTLHYCLFDCQETDLIITREADKNIAESVIIETDPFLWDGRWQISGAENMAVRALTEADIGHFRAQGLTEYENIPPAARASLPVLEKRENKENPQKHGEIWLCPLYNGAEKFNYLPMNLYVSYMTEADFVDHDGKEHSEHKDSEHKDKSP